MHTILQSVGGVKKGVGSRTQAYPEKPIVSLQPAENRSRGLKTRLCSASKVASDVANKRVKACERSVEPGRFSAGQLRPPITALKWLTRRTNAAHRMPPDERKPSGWPDGWVTLTKFQPTLMRPTLAVVAAW